MASRIRHLLRTVRGRCGPDKPRLSCRAADAVRKAGSMVNEEWPEMKLKAQVAYQDCRVANAVRKAGSMVNEEWPGMKLKAQGVYQAWRTSVKTGDEFIGTCQSTVKLVICFAAPVTVAKIAYTEYTREAQGIDEKSPYERMRAGPPRLHSLST